MGRKFTKKAYAYLIFVPVLVAMTWLLALEGLAGQQPPHNGAVTCSSCHTRATFRTLTAFNTMCANVCHKANATARNRSLPSVAASNRFNSLPNVVGKKQTSHGWRIPNTNPNAGATNYWLPAPEYNGSSMLQSKIGCTRCHRAHGDMINVRIYRSFLKGDPMGDDICFQCHASRRIGGTTNTDVKMPLPSTISFTGSNGAVVTVQPHYSHPVEVNYSSARRWKPTLFFKNPTSHVNANNPSARLKLYTTKGMVKGAVVCSTCHGPIHAADSKPYTLDNLSAFSVANYSSYDGNLLRTYGPKRDVNNYLCNSCHKVQTHRSFNCYNCHTPHKKAGDQNRYLILENISTPYSGLKAVQFISTSAMAFRYTNSVPGKSAICQVCHTGTEKALNHHYNYSSATVDRAHNYNLFCAACHVHSAGFKASGPAACGSCHKSPPADTYGKHGKHVGTSGTYDWGTADITDGRSASSYGLSCGRCHSRWAPYTSSGNYPRHQPASGFDDDLFGRYTAEVGFNVLSTMTKTQGSARNTLMNPGATYTPGARGTRMDFGNVSTAGTSGSWFSWPTTGTCTNLYCHGQFFNGYSANDPTWQGTQRCGKCHGVAPALGQGLPGKTGSTNWGAHPRHVGNGTQQYGTAAPRFTCNACHFATVTQKAISSEGLDRRYHVNGRTNVQFDAQYGAAASYYGGLNNYSAQTNRNLAWANRTKYKTCGLIYCHSDGSRLMANYSASNHTRAWEFPNWSSIKNFTTIVSNTRRCHRCHGADNGGVPFNGITAAMPGYSSRTGKGNSHYKHVVENGFMCRVCHSKTVQADNKSIYFNYSTRHVNKVYDVDILATYGGTFNSATHTCSNVNCHGNLITPAWGNTAICQNCHQSNTADADKRIRSRSRFTSWTSAAPMIYSAQWMDRGHGRSSGNYFSTNPGANLTCAACHRAAVNHGVSNNPFRLITAPDRPNIVCNRCHGVGGTGATKTGILTHASSVTGAGHNYEIKCIDCHDPHGDNNIFMVHSTVARPGNMARDMSSGRYGIITTTTGGDTATNIDFVNNVYTTDYAKKSAAPRICQSCHDETYKPSSTAGTRYRYNGSSDTKHGSGKCTTCHLHNAGFKGAGCTACHGNPPEGTKSILGGISTATQKPPSGAGSAGAHAKHISVYGSGTTTCAKCHQGGMYDSGTENTDIDLGFNAFGIYTGSGQKYTGKAAVRTGNYGYAGSGITTGDTMRCNSMKCHGGGTSQWLTKNFGTPTAPEWYTPSTSTCGKCHGAKKAAGSGSWPTSKVHAKHVGTDSTLTNFQYDFMCKLCHSTTVLTSNTTLSNSVHVNGLANFAFNTGDPRVDAGTYNGDTNINSGYGTCQGTYCHSKGTDTTQPYDGAALPNYTANWNDTASGKTGGKPCAYCHGNKASFSGVTAAMPDQGTGNSHRRHVITEKFRCSFCHANVVNNNGQIISRANHVNKFKNISIPRTYKTGDDNYVDGTDRCFNITCHGGRTTPAWGSTAKCTDCHYRKDAGTDADADNFTFQYYTGQEANAAKVYSGEWMKRGHGKTAASGNYPYSGNTGAGKNCDICHTGSLTHNNGTNYFRLRTTVTSGDSNKLCAACHGTGTELGKMGAGSFGRMTGIVSHTYANMSTLGDYKGGASGKADWNFTPKCVDCHDPHGDSNNAMLHKFINMTGSDSMGRPTLNAMALVTYTAVNGQIAWSSFARSDKNGICQRCHSSGVDFFDKAQFTSSHNAGQKCTNCHKHKKGFAPSGCDSCHGETRGMGRADWTPPKGPQGWTDSMTNRSSLHQPHAYNPRNRAGFGNRTGFACEYCHDDTVPAGNHNTGKTGANMNNLTSTSGWNGKNSQSEFSYGANNKAPADDTCYNTKCHTPRYYTRSWTKPVDCDDCHGYRRARGTQRAFQLQTTGKHKIHINWTATPNASWRKNYNFACSNCHYDWQTNNNYSTHYNALVNMTSAGPVNTRGGQFYGRGRSFKGLTSFNETLTTCSNTYCHGNFIDGNGLNQTISWKNGSVNCHSCHKSAYVDETTMPERHPKHAATAKAGYGFTCTRCHTRTTANVTTLMFTYSSHVNRRDDVYFDNQGAGGINNSGGSYDSSRRACMNIYCHSKGTDWTGPFNTRSSFAIFTANWSNTPVGYKLGTGVRAKCNYCHGNRTWTGMTSAMPNYSTVRVKANSHRVHVINNRIACRTCHYGITVNNNNTSIANRTAHANMFYNISIDPSFVSVAGKRYSTNYTNIKDGGTCMRNTCHGNSATPRWGSSVACFDCHAGTEQRSKPIKTAANGPNPVNFQQYTLYGHGRRTGATYPSSTNIGGGKWNNTTKAGCYNTDDPVGCHVSTVGHMTKDPADPFRLGATYRQDTNGLCLSCHDGVGGGESALNPAHHTAAQLGSSRTWPFTPKCVDCHDPHGDSNISMIRGTINTPRASGFNSYTDGGGSGVFGNPTGVFGTVSTTTVTFNNRNGKAAGSYASNTAGTGLCEICHSNKISPAINWYNRQGDSNKVGTTHETRTGACAPTCHNHQTGFKGAGESTGGTQCQDCHDLYTRMRDATNFHHVMSNSSAVYRNKTTFGVSETAAKERRCLQCHVDHDAFNPSVKGSNRRAANLRRNATLLTNKTGFATDFWPAKRTGSGAGSYAETKPISGPAGSNGVCISCHKSVQSKNTTLQIGAQGAKTPNFSLALYSSSSHNFQIVSGMNRFQDGSRFRANCSKCHGSYYMNKTKGAQGREEFGLHDSKYQSVNRPLGGNTSIPAPYYSKVLCFNCHSRDLRSSYDYYSSIKMNSGAKLIKSADEGKVYRHPVGANSDKHKPDEYETAAYGWNNFISAGVETKHVECVDCHNTHGGNATLTRSVGSPTGNRVAGAQYGVWGIQTSGTWPAAGVQPTYRKIGQATYQYEVCAKCHSRFAWNTYSAIFATASTATTPNGWRLTDVMKEFNPNNPGYHPVVKAGRNQPPTWTGGSKTNLNWPNARANVKWRDRYSNISGYSNVSGLDWTMIPPWNRKSTMGCTDCHQVDSTGKAVSYADYNGYITNGGWGNPQNLGDVDTSFATSSGTAAIEFDVAGAGWSGSADKILLSVWVKQNAGTTQNLGYNVKVSSTSVASGSITVAKSSAGMRKYSVDISSGMSSCMTTTCVNSNATITLTGVATYVFSVDKASLEGQFTMTEPLRGPHGSMKKWILASANTQIDVDWDGTGYVSPNSGITAGSVRENVLCWNCHRYDVYNLPAGVNENYSRFNHSLVGTGGGPADFSDAKFNTTWGIACMVCHGGGKLGAIHGDWSAAGTWQGVTLYSKGTRPVGVRLLNGSGAHLQVLNTSGGELNCYTKSTTGLGGCNVDHAPQPLAYAGTFNYTYTAY